MKYNTAFWVEGIQNLHEALRKAHDAGALPREAYPILHACAEALRYNGQASLAADILADEASLGVERHIDHKLEWARQKILALFECGTPEAVAEGTELVEYYAARLYLFPHMERAGFFLFFQCLLALRAQKPNLLQHAAAILADTEAGVRDAYFLRVTHQAGGLKKLLHLLPDLPLGTRATMAVGWSSQVLGGYGPFAAMLCRGLHSGLTLFRKLGKVMGKSQLNLLPCRGTPSPLPEHRLPILVTRAMGGIGDIMMMTPGLRALARKYPNREIHFALPKAFHPLLENNPDVVVKDIHGEPFYREDYVAVYNLTECPASRVESASLPGVRRNRIEIFAKAMGIKFNTLKKSGTRPVYRVSDEERIWAQAFFDENGLEPEKCVAVQPYAEDSYRNWSGIENFSLQLANDKYVLVFHGKKTLRI